MVAIGSMNDQVRQRLRTPMPKRRIFLSYNKWLFGSKWSSEVKRLRIRIINLFRCGVSQEVKFSLPKAQQGGLLYVNKRRTRTA